MSYHISIEDRPEQQTAVIRDEIALDEISQFLGDVFDEVGKALAAQGLFPTGPPFAQYRMVAAGFDVAAGFPTSAEVSATGRIEPMLLPAGPLATTVHVGSYSEVGAAYDSLTVWMTESGYAPAGDPWELYLDGPEVAEPRTVVCFPCQEL